MLSAKGPKAIAGGGTRNQYQGWRGSVAALAIGLVSAVGISPAAAETMELPVETVVRADPGTEVVVRVSAVDDEFVGATCSLSIVTQNQESVHPGNNLVVRSGDSFAVLVDVESEPGQVTNTIAPEIELGDEIVVSLVMGSDGVFSGGFNVAFTCPTVGDNGGAPQTSAATTTSSTTSTVPVTTSTTTATSTTSTTTATSTTSTTTATSTTTSTTIRGAVEGGSETNETTPTIDTTELARTGTDQSAWLSIVAAVFILVGTVLRKIGIWLDDDL